jgi:adenosine deaminase/aminodeoxyfutalosine deaminase
MRSEYPKWVAVIAAYKGLNVGMRHADNIVAVGTIIDGLKKAELHVHLEGSIEPETIAELDGKITAEQAAARYRFHDFQGFIEAYKWTVQYLRTPDDFALIARRLFESMARQNVRYAEVNLSVGVMLWRGQDFGPILDALNREAERSQVEIWWIADAVRQFGLEHVWTVARMAAERVNDRVIGFGIGGNEVLGPAELFTEVFDYARKAGLHLVPHAGETVGPESVWAALRLGAERIGHGIRAVDDPALVAELARRQIPLEICITSNVATGSVAKLEYHPVRRLYDAGVPIVLNTDDPGIFGTTLNREYRIAQEVFGFSDRELTQLAENSFRFGFRSTEL